MSLYGPGREGVKKSHHDTPADDPFYVWDGTSGGNCAITLKDRGSAGRFDRAGEDPVANEAVRVPEAAPGGEARERRLAGEPAVGERLDGLAGDEWAVGDLRWRKLDIKTMIEAAPVVSPDLTRVEQSLMTGCGTPASTRVDWLEVYGRPLARQR